MRTILIDCTSLARTKTGIEHYTEQLCKALLPLLQSREFTPVFLVQGERPEWIGNDVRFKSYRGKSLIILNVLWIPWRIFRIQPSIVIFPAFPPSPLLYLVRLIRPTSIVRVIYDAVVWLHKDTASLRSKFYYVPLEKIGVTRYDKIATVSENSMQEIVRLFPQVASRIANIGASLVSRDDQTDGSPEVSFPQGRYFLFVGTVDKRKNLVTALKAFKQFSQLERDYKFFITGRDAWGSRDIATAIRELGLKDRVVLTGYVSDRVLADLYRRAEALVFPSIYEGYGLPIVEAMSLGCPVIASNTSAIPEAAGGAALLVDNILDPQAWCAAMLRLSNEPGLRDELVGRGRARVKMLSWNLVASRMMALIEDKQALTHEL